MTMQEKKQRVLNAQGRFTWMFNHEFFVETKDFGNFVFSDPEYDGDGTLRATKQSYDAFDESRGQARFGRDKGEHMIRAFTGEAVTVIL